MKALRYYGKRDIRYEDIPEPSPGPGQVKVKVVLAGICGSDLRRYDSDPYAREQDKIPVTLGHEFAGTVVAGGKGVTDFEVGDRVSGIGSRYCGECFFCKRDMYNFCPNTRSIPVEAVDGCMAEYMVAPSSSFLRLPDKCLTKPGLRLSL